MEELKEFWRIKNWEKFQLGVRADKRGKLTWIKDYTDREEDADFSALTMFQRAVLEGLCRIAGKSKSRLVPARVEYVLNTLHVVPEERHCIPQAIAKLLSRGFIIPENNENFFADLQQKNKQSLPEKGEEIARTPCSLTGSDSLRSSSPDTSNQVSEQASQPPVFSVEQVENREVVLGHEDGTKDFMALNSEGLLLPRSGGRIDSEAWEDGLAYYMDCFKLLPEDMQKPCHNEESVLAFIECATDLERRLDFKAEWKGSQETGWTWDARHPIRDLVHWNRSHKGGGLVWSCGNELAKSYWSDSAKSALAQFQAHDPGACPKCKQKGKGEGA